MKCLSLARDGQQSHQPPSTLFRHTANITSTWASWLPGERRPHPAAPHALSGGCTAFEALEDSACSATISLRLLAPIPTGECPVTTVRGWITPASCRLTSKLVLKWHL